VPDEGEMGCEGHQSAHAHSFNGTTNLFVLIIDIIRERVWGTWRDWKPAGFEKDGVCRRGRIHVAIDAVRAAKEAVDGVRASRRYK